MNELKLIVDRISDEIAFCETDDFSIVEISLNLLPKGIHEGSVIFEQNGEYLSDTEEEEQRRNFIFDLQNSLFDD